MNFRITGLPAEDFDYIATLDDEQLRQRGIVRRVADGPGYPCRISLTDAPAGTPVFLLNHVHLDVASPYRASHAIYVRTGEVRYDARDAVPDQLRRRLLAVKSFDGSGMMVNADIVEGAQLESVIEKLFADARADYLHVHFAKPGCYAARVDRI